MELRKKKQQQQQTIRNTLTYISVTEQRVQLQCTQGSTNVWAKSDARLKIYEAARMQATVKEDRDRNIKLHKHQKRSYISFHSVPEWYTSQSNCIPNYLNSIEINFSIPFHISLANRSLLVIQTNAIARGLRWKFHYSNISSVFLSSEFAWKWYLCSLVWFDLVSFPFFWSVWIIHR